MRAIHLAYHWEGGGSNASWTFFFFGEPHHQRRRIRLNASLLFAVDSVLLFAVLCVGLFVKNHVYQLCTHKHTPTSKRVKKKLCDAIHFSSESECMCQDSCLWVDANMFAGVLRQEALFRVGMT